MDDHNIVALNAEPLSRNDAAKRVDQAEIAGRVAICVALPALVFAGWFVQFWSAADWSERLLRIAPRLSVMALGFSMALVLQGCRLKARTLLVGAIIAAIGMVWLHGYAGEFEIRRLDTEMINSSLIKTRSWIQAGGRVYFHSPSNTFASGVVLLLMRLECALFAAVLLGTWIGRGAWSGWHFVTLLMFGAVSDFWINWFHVTDSMDPTALDAALRLPFVPAIGGLAGAPGFIDVLFVSAAFESARRFRMHTLSLVLGTLAGYCSGSFLGLEPSPAWTHLSMLMLACGVLAAAWPDLKLDSNAIGKLFLSVALLIFVLISLVTLQHKLNPRPERRLEEERHVRDLATPLHFITKSNVPMYS